MNTALNIEQARFNMVEQQIRPWEVLDQEILDLLYLLHREKFVPDAYRALAFCDLEIPLGNEPSERMWAPRVEARVLQNLNLKKTDRILEVGTGSGYFAALLAHCAGRVFSVEINARLAKLGEANLAAEGIDNVTVENGDAARGWSRHAPYDVIVLTASTPVVPESLLEQIKPGGRLFAIVGDEPVMVARILSRDAAGSFVQKELFETCFAPLANALQPTRFQF
ncbi:MAG: protein-L-isoaspartate O-methyltransferase [Betaproteobacteria bacterium RIFCSPLOWO2_12_FULL_63_13]|nr:MAG: protein-L-isoaspartate O-methyltransferase [Betaproteobacteria bacterium RIFCSPLOWO2_12_FULL_63_13]